MNGLIEITDDLFDIAKRLKEIDERYVVYRNVKANRYEVYANGALQVAVPFEKLDVRTVDLVRSTRIEYANKIIAEIEKQNARLTAEHEKCARERILANVEDVL